MNASCSRSPPVFSTSTANRANSGSTWSAGQTVGCYYGGQPATVARWVDDHVGWAGPVAELVTHPFASGHDSLAARVEMESRLYARP
mgnify:CR=1 FL=1